jgi:PAS domain S-box-containing protein
MDNNLEPDEGILDEVTRRIIRTKNLLSPNSATFEAIDSEGSIQQKQLHIQHQLLLFLSQCSNLEKALQYIIDVICTIHPIDCGGIYISYQHENCIRLAAYRNLSPEFIQKTSLYTSESPSYKALHEGKILCMNLTGIQQLPNKHLYKQEGLSMVCSIPIFYHEAIIGAFNLGSKTAADISDNDLEFFDSLASIIGGTISRIHAEEASHRSQENLNSFFDSLDDFAFVVDASGTFVEINPVVTQRLGYQPHEIIGQSVFALHPEDKKDEVLKIVDAMFKGDSYYCTIPLLDKQGHEIPVETKISHGSWNGQKVLFGISRDITQVKAHKEKLQQNSLKLQKINDCLTTLGPDGNQNITKLTALCGELLNATCALYNRLQNGELCSIGQWLTPPDFKPTDKPDGHICYDVIKKGLEDPLVIYGLQETSYATTDPNVSAYGLQTYCGIAVRSKGQAVGSLCVVYQENRTISPEDQEIMGIIAAAIGNEDHRKQIEDELQENEDRYHSLFENNVLAILLGEPDGKILKANKVASQLFGYSEAELIQLGRQGIIDNAAKGLNEALETRRIQGSIDTQLQFIKKDGSKFIGQVYSTIFKDLDGHDKTSVIILDVTEFVHTQKQLKASEELYRTLIERMPDGVYKSTHEGRFIEVNPAMVQMFGYSCKEEMLALNIPEAFYYAPEEREELTLKEIKGELLQYKVKKKDGSPIWVEDHGWYTYDEDGNILTHEGVLRDISARHQAQKDLEESEDRYRTFIESTTDLVYLKDENLNYLVVNKSLANFFNRPVEEVVGKDDFALLPFEAASICKLNDQQAQLHEGVLVSEETMGKHIFETSKFRVQLSNGKYGVGGYIRNITQRKKNDQQLANQAQKLLELISTKDKLFSVIAHDLRSPFNSILGLSDLLMDSYHEFDEPTRIQSIKNIHRSAHQAFQLLDNLLQWARSQTGKIEVQQEFVDVCACINQIIELYNDTADAKSIKLITAHEGKCYAFADKNLTLTVLRNLLSNAIKFTNPNGRIIITAHSYAESIEVKMVDNGVGMPSEVVDSILNAGLVTSTKGTQNEKGSGLGMLLCKDFIDRMGGNMLIESTPGKGTSITLSFPK